MRSESTVTERYNSIVLSWLNNLISLLGSWRDWYVGWHYVSWSLKLRSSVLHILVAVSHRLVLLNHNLWRFTSVVSYLTIRFLVRDNLSAQIHILVNQIWVFIAQSTLIYLIQLYTALVETGLYEHLLRLSGPVESCGRALNHSWIRIQKVCNYFSVIEILTIASHLISILASWLTCLTLLSLNLKCIQSSWA